MTFKSMEDFKNYCEETKPINFAVYYSPLLNRIILEYGGRVVNVHGEKGIFFTLHGNIGKSYVRIGNLI